MNQRMILVVDDDESTRSYLEQFLTARGYSVEVASSADEAISRLANGYHPNVITLDLLLPDPTGKEVLAYLKKRNLPIPVIILTGMGQTRSVVDIMQLGASDYLVKPFEEEELLVAIENVLEKQELRNEIKSLQRQLENAPVYTDIVSSSPRMLRIKEVARHVADTDVPVLILGESGVGKEVLARFIHCNSSRADKPMVKVNCAALPNDLLESELFGHERGAFTGALNEKPGKFELAGKGTILLDEIAEMSQHLQAKLLHVLQDGEFSRLGGRRSIHAECRILASTNRKLSNLVARGEFREDLFYRLNVIPIEIPSLRERREDIPLLSNVIFQKYRLRYNPSLQQLPPEIIDVFMNSDWPGNVRQLENIIKRYLILPDPASVLSEMDRSTGGDEIPVANSYHLKEVSAQAAERAEKEMVLRLLDETNWNRKQAALRLGICYKALLNKLKKWQVRQPSRGLPPPPIVEAYETAHVE
jgi:two-component system, NtrC family, response regulator AtoC